jgi:hypothetical protein
MYETEHISHRQRSKHQENPIDSRKLPSAEALQKREHLGLADILPAECNILAIECKELAPHRNAFHRFCFEMRQAVTWRGWAFECSAREAAAARAAHDAQHEVCCRKQTERR